MLNNFILYIIECKCQINITYNNIYSFHLRNILIAIFLHTIYSKILEKGGKQLTIKDKKTTNK